jgi:hypothetical protein
MAKKRTAAQKRATAKLVALNKARRSGSAKKRRRPARSAPSVTRTANPSPRRRRRSASKGSVVTRVVRRRRNPIGGGLGEFVSSTLVPSAIGGGGALLLDVAMAMMPLPVTMKTGPLAPVVKVAGAVALGLVAGKVTSRRTANQIAAGALTVTMYNLVRGVIVKATGGKIPGLSGYEDQMGVGEYVGEYISGDPAMPALSYQTDDGVGYINSGMMVGEVDDDGSVDGYETGVYR